MPTPAEELARLKVRIADLERCAAVAQEDDGQTLGRSERQHILDMLQRTLQAIKARRQIVEKQAKDADTA